METWDAMCARRNVREHSSVGEQEKARAILGVPDGYQVAFLLGVGYPADRPLAPIRKPNRRLFDQVVHRGHW